MIQILKTISKTIKLFRYIIRVLSAHFAFFLNEKKIKNMKFTEKKNGKKKYW